MPTVTVGPTSPPYDETSIQTALSSITGSASNRGTIMVAPGRYEEQVTDNKSHVDVIADVPGTVVVINTNTQAGGTYRIAINPQSPWLTS